MKKKCPVCKITFETVDDPRYQRTYCDTPCKRKAASIEYQIEHGVSHTAIKMRRFLTAGLCRECGAEPVTGSTLCDKCKAKKRRDNKRHRDAIRSEVLIAYGGKCACCGERHPEFLGVDHVNGKGNRHRTELKVRGSGFYKWLKKNGFPRKEFRLLCHNCNLARGFYGYCPHRRKKVS